MVIPTSRPIRDTPGQALLEMVVAATRGVVVVPVDVDHIQRRWWVTHHKVYSGERDGSNSLMHGQVGVDADSPRRCIHSRAS